MSPIFLATLMLMGMFLLQAAIVLGIIHWISKRSRRPAQTKMVLIMGLLALIFVLLLVNDSMYSQGPNWLVYFCLLVILISACIQLRKRKEKM
ncbi:hypothetical protein C1I60_22630 [Paenibacillus terrae]|uniref:Uncharacterized protein n=1 Tax=Paenibacillus terrae TaxID=159743 RepID=A0A4U2PRK5_9BACL|nr:hypothetical protein [Paenibacillus terrae]TKH42093.1 hypothetical protein C1I60_22630 [Paenibacillus terrae]